MEKKELTLTSWEDLIRKWANHYHIYIYERNLKELAVRCHAHHLSCDVMWEEERDGD